MYPYFIAKGTAWFFFIFAALAVLGTFAQINPVWLYGPYTPVAVSSASQPDWYLGMLEGALRIMPAWEINFLGHSLSLSVLIPAFLPLGIILGGAAIWPRFEAWATGDRAVHHVLDRPRNVPFRTGIGMAAVVFYGVLWAEGGNDVIADHLDIPLYTITWIARAMVIAGPVLAFFVTRWICQAVQRKKLETLEHGVETGIIRQSPEGGFDEVTRPVSAQERAVLAAESGWAMHRLPARSRDGAKVLAPGSGTVKETARGLANRAFVDMLPLPPGAGHNGNGHNGNGHNGDGHPAPARRPSTDDHG